MITSLANAIAVAVGSDGSDPWVEAFAGDVLAGEDVTLGDITDRIARDSWVPGRGTPPGGATAEVIEPAIRAWLAASDLAVRLDSRNAAARAATAVHGAMTAVYDAMIAERAAALNAVRAAEPSWRANLWAKYVGTRVSPSADAAMAAADRRLAEAERRLELLAPAVQRSWNRLALAQIAAGMC